MELEADANAIPDESIFDTSGDHDAENFENDRCGICMDAIIDRGVLDGCQHWFCFECIDNWAAITNLCPLCQNEFQSITCVPVYNTIGNGKVEDDSLIGDDDWLIKGTNNTLTFPSYYIDENAVICLDGDGCKIRNGMASTIEDSNLDTSIACDSCDIWYHAFCVGFDPGSTSENSWLCPRCIIEELPKNSDGVPMQISNTQYCPETATRECSVEATFSGKVSVSVADAGETAIVVSFIEVKQWNDEHSGNLLSVLDMNEEEKTETLPSYSSGNSPMTETQLNQKIDFQSNLITQDASLALSLSSDMHTLPCNSLPLGELETTSADEALSDPNGPDGCKISSNLFSDKANTYNGAPDSESNFDLKLGLSMGSSSSDDMGNSDATESHFSAISNWNEDSLSVDKMSFDAHEDATGFIGVKRKSTSPRVPPGDEILVTDCNEHNIQSRVKMDAPAKKARSGGNSEPAALKCEVKNLKSVSTSDDKLGDAPENDDVDSDIMNIVQGTYQRPANGLSHLSAADKSPQEKDNGTGLRVKKIVRRAAEDESSKLIEKLRKEIKETVQNKSTKGIDQSTLFDSKLLAAFRAAIEGPRPEQAPVKRTDTMVVKTKKTLLQKGKARENLTEKIYGTSNGRRKRAWDRDWEVEFWKHRCNNSARPEKFETLKSVLDLLRKNSESSEMEKEAEDDGGTAILSRLYLADTSVFPRKDDIKPLSALSGHNNHEMNKKSNLGNKVSKPGKDKCSSQIPVKTNLSSTQASISSFDKVRKGGASNLKDEAASKKVNSNIQKKNPTSMSNGSKMNAQSIKETPGKSDMNKRKWAMEVLARKNATVAMNATREKQEEKAMLKGNFPLLVQLPSDMRPVLAPSHHNKVPISVRQALLYRLTEHFLRKANLPVIRRTAETELAVADATSIEKEIADKSNSRLVYVNLCSEALSQHANSSKLSGDAESNHSAPATKDPCSALSGEEALRMAGLTDSPPRSPSHMAKGLKDDDDEPSTMAIDEEGPKNVFDMDTHPELDIYGDFEYDLDDDCFNESVLKVSKSQPEEIDTRMKVVFSTLNASKINNGPTDSKDHEGSQIVKVPIEPPSLEHHKDKTLEVRADASFPSAEPLQGEIGELSLAECEELYGPDKEPLSKRFPDKTSRETDLLPGRAPAAANGALKKNLNFTSKNNNAQQAVKMEGESCAEIAFVTGRLPADHNSPGRENSPNHSLAKKNVQEKEKKTNNSKQSDIFHSISKKVEFYVKEHIRPLCKSGVITPEQYRWAVGKTTEKVMRFHSKDKNANFLIKEGEKVKKLAEQYVEAATQQRPGKIS